MVFQKPNPFPKSIFDNVAFGPRLHRRLSRSAASELVEKSLTQAALWNEVKGRLRTPALSLSGGQQQRLCIARAIASSSKGSGALPGETLKRLPTPSIGCLLLKDEDSVDSSEF